jgi:phage regulator Rha-like protein
MNNNKNEAISQIESRIFTIRNMQIMLDSHLAELYGVETKQINRAVKRNIKRFPDSFMFQLNSDDWENLKCQIGTSSSDHGGKRKLPFVFNEQGVAMLSSVLRGETAIDVSIKIIETFVEIRKWKQANQQLYYRIGKLESKQIENDDKFERIFNVMEKNTEFPDQGIFYHGQIFDAYKWVSELFKRAKSSIIIFDNYIDDSTLIHLQKRKKGVKSIIFTQKISEQLQLDINKFNAQYEPIYVKIQKDIHDRFMVIDNKELYHIGASLKDLGKKLFAFTKMEMNVIDFLEKAIGVNVSGSHE